MSSFASAVAEESAPGLRATFRLREDGPFDKLSEEEQLQAANWEAFVRSCSVLCCRLPPLLKVLACRCLLSFLMCNYKDGRTP